MIRRRDAIFGAFAVAAMPVPSSASTPVAPPQIMTVWLQGKQVGGCCFQAGDVVDNANSLRRWIAVAHPEVRGAGIAAEDLEVRIG